MVGWEWIANKNKSRFSIEKIPATTKMGDVNAILDQLGKMVNKKYAELKAEIEKNNNALTSTIAGLKIGIEQGIKVLKEDEKKNQEYLDNILAKLQLHTSVPPPSHNPPLDPFNTPHPSTHKMP